MIGRTNLKVLVLDTDYYARQAINSYLAWDRRTRVVHLAETMQSVVEYVRRVPDTEWPDVVLLDALAADTPDELAELVKHIEDTIPNVMTLVLDRKLNMDTLRACVKARVNGYLLRDELRIRIAWAIVWAQAHDFIVTQSVKDALKDEFEDRLFRARVVPDRRTYPELTERIRQARSCRGRRHIRQVAPTKWGCPTVAISRGYAPECVTMRSTADMSRRTGIHAVTAGKMRGTGSPQGGLILDSDCDWDGIAGFIIILHNQHASRTADQRAISTAVDEMPLSAKKWLHLSRGRSGAAVDQYYIGDF